MGRHSMTINYTKLPHPSFFRLAVCHNQVECLPLVGVIYGFYPHLSGYFSSCAPVNTMGTMTKRRGYGDPEQGGSQKANNRGSFLEECRRHAFFLLPTSPVGRNFDLNYSWGINGGLLKFEGCVALVVCLRNCCARIKKEAI